MAPTDPIDQFRAWLSDATAAGIREPTAGALATASKDARPSIRTCRSSGSQWNSRLAHGFSSSSRALRLS